MEMYNFQKTRNYVRKNFFPDLLDPNKHSIQSFNTV